MTQIAFDEMFSMSQIELKEPLNERGEFKIQENRMTGSRKRATSEQVIIFIFMPNLSGEVAEENKTAAIEYQIDVEHCAMEGIVPDFLCSRGVCRWHNTNDRWKEVNRSVIMMPVTI